MSSWGSVDFRELKHLADRLEKLAETDMDKVCVNAGNECQQVLLNKAKKRTPVGHRPVFDEPKTVKVKGASGKTRSFLSKSGAILSQYWTGYRGGTLRDAWKALPPVCARGHYTFVVLNPIRYASFVEYGHRQMRGRYVPAIGKRLKASWVKGRYMLTISENELKSVMPRIIDKNVDKALKEAFDGNQ